MTPLPPLAALGESRKTYGRRQLAKRLLNGWTLLPIMLLVMLFTPALVQRHIIFRSNLSQLERRNGRYLLENIPLERGEKYTIYLEYLPGFSFPFPFFEVQSGSKFQPPVRLFGRQGTSIPNTLKAHVAYGTLSSTANKVAVFRAPSNGAQHLYVQFAEARPERPSDYEIVVRRSRYSSLPLLILSDLGSNVLILIGIGLWMVWRATASALSSHTWPD